MNLMKTSAPRRGVVRRLVEKRLGGYRQALNQIDSTAPLRIEGGATRVAVIGGGLAGAAAAMQLAERGFVVELLEKNSYLGGKIGSWPVDFDGDERMQVEHGFHAFFRQYYNLRRMLEKVGADKHLMPIDDYLIMTQRHGNFSFQNINPTPLLNILSLSRSGIYSFRNVLTNLQFRRMQALLQYDPARTFAEFDQMSFQEFADAAKLPPPMRLMFTTFSRAFFAEPQLISMAELIKSFHFYFLSTDHGLIYDVLDDDFQLTLWDPIDRHLREHGATLRLGIPVERLEKTDQGFEVDGQPYDAVILAADLPGVQKLVANSTSLQDRHPNFVAQMQAQKISQKYAVLRLWLDRDTERKLPFFVFTDALKILDSVTLYHRMEKSSAAWVARNGGGIFELHSYALPAGFDDPTEVRLQLIREFESYFPELAGASIRHEHLQLRGDFTAFHTGLYANRPGPKTEVPNLYLAGDWVKLPCPAMLMEAAVTSAWLAVNDILATAGLREELVETVPLRGLLA